jgi:two-component system, NarL family, nitrate/nitrite response regulator NarL
MLRLSESVRIPREGTFARGREWRVSARVFVISSVCLYRDGLVSILSGQEAIEFVGAAAGAPETLGALVALDVPPDVVLHHMASTESASAARLPSESHDVRVLALTVPNREDALLICVELDVSDFVSVNASAEELVSAVESVARDEMLCSPSFAAALLRRAADLSRRAETREDELPLTAREREIVRLIEEGLSNKQIAQRLGIHLKTVKNHVQHILEKLGVHSRLEVVARLRARTPRATGH